VRFDVSRVNLDKDHLVVKEGAMPQFNPTYETVKGYYAEVLVGCAT